MIQPSKADSQIVLYAKGRFRDHHDPETDLRALVAYRAEIPQRTTFRKFYKDSNAIYLEETSTTANQIDNVNWNDTSLSGAAAIKPMSTGFYKKDSYVS